MGPFALGTDHTSSHPTTPVGTGCALQGIAQDKPGFVYLIITKPNDQSASDVSG